MAQIETWLECDLDKMVQVVPLRGNLFSADNQANLIGVEVKKNGQAATGLTGTVYGYVIRQDGYTVTITGTLSSNKASIVLPSYCYSVVGPISIVIKLGATTLAACCGTVTRTTTDAIVDPGHVIPSIEELLAQIAACQTATTNANNATTAANNAASNANSKASAANTAAGNANTATATANAAAAAITGMTADAESVSSSGSAGATVSDVGGHKHVHFQIPRGADGRDGIIAQVDMGLFAMHIDSSGDLICTYSTEAPPLSINSNGDLIYSLS